MVGFVTPSLPLAVGFGLPSPGPLRSTDVTPLHRYYGPIRHPLAPVPFPGDAGYRVKAGSRWFPSVARRASPVAWCVLVTVPPLPPRRSGPPLQPVCGVPCCLRQPLGGSASGLSSVEATYVFAFAAARRLAHHPKGWFYRWASGHWSPSSLPSKLRGPGSYPDGIASR